MELREDAYFNCGLDCVQGGTLETGKRVASLRLHDDQSDWGKETSLGAIYYGRKILWIQSKTFHVVYKNIPAAFTIDWIDGFLLKPFASPSYHFVYGFSQLKGSSDDGKATLTLQFQEAKRPGMKPNLIKEEVTNR